MADTKVRAWVQRLLRGDIRTGDLASIFLFARDRPDGGETVREIGHFVAHHTERQKGIITASTRDWLSIVLFHTPNIQNPGVPINADRLPSIIKDYLIAMRGRLDPGELKKRTGFDHVTAARKIDKIISEMSENADGTWQFRTVDKKKIALLGYAIQVLDARPAFDGLKLVSDLFGILKSAGAITSEEIKSSNHVASVFQLFAVSAMHNCRVTNKHQDPIRLSYGPNDDTLCVHASVKMPGTLPGQHFYMASPIFITDVRVQDGCHEEVVNAQNLDRDLEVSPQGKLSFLS